MNLSGNEKSIMYYLFHWWIIMYYIGMFHICIYSVHVAQTFGYIWSGFVVACAQLRVPLTGSHHQGKCLPPLSHCWSKVTVLLVPDTISPRPIKIRKVCFMNCSSFGFIMLQWVVQPFPQIINVRFQHPPKIQGSLNKDWFPCRKT